MGLPLEPRVCGAERGRGMLLPGVLPAGAGEGAGWKRPACACACACCVWRGRDVDEERALFLPAGAQLILLPGAAQAVSALDCERGRRASQRSAERRLKRAERGKNQIYAWNWASFSPMQKGICSTFLPSSAPVS